MFEWLRGGLFGARAEPVRPIRDIPSVPPTPGSGAAAWLAQAEQVLRVRVGELAGSLDEGTGDVFDPSIQEWGVLRSDADDREYEEYVAELRRRLALARALLTEVERAHQRCERAWQRADAEFVAAGARLGASDNGLTDEPRDDSGAPGSSAGSPSPTPFPSRNQSRRVV